MEIFLPHPPPLRFFRRKNRRGNPRFTLAFRALFRAAVAGEKARAFSAPEKPPPPPGENLPPGIDGFAPAPPAGGRRFFIRFFRPARRGFSSGGTRRHDRAAAGPDRRFANAGLPRGATFRLRAARITPQPAARRDGLHAKKHPFFPVTGFARIFFSTCIFLAPSAPRRRKMNHSLTKSRRGIARRVPLFISVPRAAARQPAPLCLS
ncbi:MAG: hypothetical protein GC185_10615 [Alphaproteobacteria bacterium]|nr:hypothetical protein [Alphaproteobacteria bacterium]